MWSYKNHYFSSRAPVILAKSVSSSVFVGLTASVVRTMLKMSLAVQKYHLLRKAVGRFKRHRVDDPELLARATTVLKKLKLDHGGYI